MARPKIIGTPGARLAQQQTRHLRDALVHGSAALALVVGVATVLIILDGALAYVAAAAGCAGALVESNRYQKAQSLLARNGAGLRAERRTGRALRNAPADFVVHGAVIGAGGDCDHIVLGPIAALVETKHGKGAVQVQSGALVVNGRKMPRDPLQQARNQAASLSKRTLTAVAAVVCVTEMTGRPFIHDGVYVTSAADLNAVLAGFPAVLNTGQAQRIVLALD